MLSANFEYSYDAKPVCACHTCWLTQPSERPGEDSQFKGGHRSREQLRVLFNALQLKVAVLRSESGSTCSMFLLYFLSEGRKDVYRRENQSQNIGSAKGSGYGRVREVGIKT